MTESVADFVVRLAQRGVSFSLRSNRLCVQPQRAYKSLGDEDRAFIRDHRQELKQRVRDGALPAPVDATAATTQTPQPQTPEPASLWHDLSKGPVECLGQGRTRPVKVDEQASADFVAAMRRRTRDW